MVEQTHLINRAIDAGAAAAAEKAYSTFDISNSASWDTYTRHIREAMDLILADDPDLKSFSDTSEAKRAAIAKEDGFEIGVISKSDNRVLETRFLKFSTVDLKL